MTRKEDETFTNYSKLLLPFGSSSIQPCNDQVYIGDFATLKQVFNHPDAQGFLGF